MATSDVVLAMLRGYASKTHQVQIRLPQFAGFVRQYAENYQHKHSSLRLFLDDTAAMLSPVLNELAESGKCALEYEGSEIKQIVFTQYLGDKIRASYQEIAQDPNVPFPNEESLRVSAPSTIATVDIRSEFVRWLSARPEEPQILRLSFPDNIVNMLITTDLLGRRLLEYAVMKVRSYLSEGNNSAFMLQRLKESFTLKDQTLQAMLRDIVTRPSLVVENLIKPTEFTFSFWAHLASTILKELRNKSDKLVQDYGYCQSCYLIGLYNVYFKGLSQRDHDVEVALKNLDKRLLERPYFFTIGDVYDLRDEKGIPFAKRVPKEQLDAYLERKTHASEEERLPELMRVHTHIKKEFLIHKEVILGLTLTKITQAALVHKDDYVAEWYENLGEFKKTAEMLQDEVFLKDLEERVKTDDPLLHALLSYELLYLCRRERTVDDDINRKIDRILDLKRGALIPLDELLQVRRKDMLAEARLKLPIWKTIPVFKHIFRLFDRILAGRRDSASAGRRSGATVKVLDDGTERTASRGGRARRLSSQRGEFSGDGGATQAQGANAEDQFGPYAVPDLNDLGGTPGAAEERNMEDLAPEPAAREARAPAAGSSTAASSATARQRAAAYKKAVAELARKIIGNNQSIDTRLKELASRWNPLIAEKAKGNLVEDVNSFVRDQVRILKRSMLKKPPDLERVENLSARIAESKIFADIKRKDEFREYVKLYLVKVLGKV